MALLRGYPVTHSRNLSYSSTPSSTGATGIGMAFIIDYNIL
jgi:hypothetical protein